MSHFLIGGETEHVDFSDVSTWKLDFQRTGLVDGTCCVLLFSCLVAFLNYFCKVCNLHYMWSLKSYVEFHHLH